MLPRPTPIVGWMALAAAVTGVAAAVSLGICLRVRPDAPRAILVICIVGNLAAVVMMLTVWRRSRPTAAGDQRNAS